MRVLWACCAFLTNLACLLQTANASDEKCVVILYLVEVVLVFYGSGVGSEVRADSDGGHISADVTHYVQQFPLSHSTAPEANVEL